MSLTLSLEESTDTSKIILYTKGKANKDLDLPLYNKNGSQFLIKCQLDSIKAGVRVVLYAQ